MSVTIVKDINNRYAMSGAALRDGRPTMFLDELDDIAVSMNWSRVIGSAAISTVTITADGINYDGLTNTATTISFNVYGKPRCNAKLVISVALDDGQVMTDRINVVERDL